MNISIEAHYKLKIFAGIVEAFFQEPLFQVGSSLLKRDWNDVDTVVILGTERFYRLGLRSAGSRQSLTLAYCLMGKELTGLPIDFKIVEFTIWQRLFSELPIQRILPIENITPVPNNLRIPNVK